MLKRICMALLAVVLCGAVQSVSAANPRVVFMGDSITEGWGGKVPSFFTNNNFLCKGISGHTTGDMLARYTNDVINKKPQVVVILAGTNDIDTNTPSFCAMSFCMDLATKTPPQWRVRLEDIPLNRIFRSK